MLLDVLGVLVNLGNVRMRRQVEAVHLVYLLDVQMMHGVVWDLSALIYVLGRLVHLIKHVNLEVVSPMLDPNSSILELLTNELYFI